MSKNNRNIDENTQKNLKTPIDIRMLKNDKNAEST